jgi:phage recombination protein Bet
MGQEVHAMSAPQTAVAQLPPANSLVVRMAQRFGIDPSKMLSTLKATAFRQGPNDPEVSNEQMMALLVVAEQYGLNPWTRELYAFPDRKNGIVPVVGLDGWSRIINEHPQFDGMDFADGPACEGKHKGAPEWIECVMYRKDRSHPIRVRERLIECYRETGPWNSHPGRMLRTKAMIQCARVAFGFVGIADPDEAERIIDANAIQVPETAPAVAAINAAVTGKPAIEHQQTTTIPAVVGEGEKVAAAPTWQQIAEEIEAARTEDALTLAGDKIRSMPDGPEKVSAQALYDEKVAAFGEDIPQ